MNIKNSNTVGPRIRRLYNMFQHTTFSRYDPRLGLDYRRIISSASISKTDPANMCHIVQLNYSAHASIYFYFNIIWCEAENLPNFFHCQFLRHSIKFFLYKSFHFYSDIFDPQKVLQLKSLIGTEYVQPNCSI